MQTQPTSPASAHTCTATTSDKASYALAKQVPDMERGFTIHTNYGDIVIEPGPGAVRIRKAVEAELKREVAA